MDVFYAYTYGTAAWLGIQAVPMVVLPKMIISVLAKEIHQATDVEVYFCRSLGFALTLVALIVLFFTGSIPLSSSISEPVSLEDNDPKAPYAVPILRVTTLFHGLSMVYCYMRYVNYGQTGYILGAMGYGAIASLGLWCVVFGTSGGRISKRTGADKRMAGFPFKNASAYNKRKDRKMAHSQNPLLICLSRCFGSTASSSFLAGFLTTNAAFISNPVAHPDGVDSASLSEANMDADTLQDFKFAGQPIQFPSYGAGSDGQELEGPQQDDSVAAVAAAAVGYGPVDPADANNQAFDMNGATGKGTVPTQLNTQADGGDNLNNTTTSIHASNSPRATRSPIQTRAEVSTTPHDGNIATTNASMQNQDAPMNMNEDGTDNFQEQGPGQGQDNQGMLLEPSNPNQPAQGNTLVWKNASSVYPNGTPGISRSQAQTRQSPSQANIFNTPHGLAAADPWIPHQPDVTPQQFSTPEGGLDSKHDHNNNIETGADGNTKNLDPAVAANPFSDTFPLIPNPPDLEAWREKLFNVKEPLILSEEEFLTYFPHVDNVYSHRSTQKYKRKPFVSHYWDCRLKGRPSGTPKSDDPNKKKRKRQARERDLCDVKIKVTEYFSAEQARKMGLTAIGDTSSLTTNATSSLSASTLANTDPALLGLSSGAHDLSNLGEGGGGGTELTIVLEDGISGSSITGDHNGHSMSMPNLNPKDPNFGLLEFPRRRLPEGHPGADGKRWYTIQRVRGNPGGGAVKDKRDSIASSNGGNNGGTAGDGSMVEDDDDPSSTAAVDPNLDLDHKHTLEESDRIKKNSVQRWLLKEEKEKKRLSKLATPNTTNTPTINTDIHPRSSTFNNSESLSPSFRASGLAFFTARSHSTPAPSKITFFANSLCPFAQRVWIALEVKGIPYQMVEVMPAHLDPFRPPELLEVNPEGHIPCLRHGNWGIWESGVVLEYLEDLAMGYSLLPLGNPQLRAHCRLWTDHINRKIVPAFYALLLTPPPATSSHRQKQQQQRPQQHGDLEMMDEDITTEGQGQGQAPTNGNGNGSNNGNVNVGGPSPATAPAAAQHQQQHSILISTLQKHITSLVNASHATGPFFLGSEMGFVDVAFAPWIIRLSRVLSYYRGFPRPEVGTRWQQWVDAIEADERVKRTVSDENSYHGVYRGVGEDGWDSLVGTSTGTGGATAGIAGGSAGAAGVGGAGGRKPFVEIEFAKRAVAQEGFGLGGDVWGRLSEESVVHGGGGQ
ncbi:hypothetical protein ABEF95_000392 [Exophiala dermatitidis]